MKAIRPIRSEADHAWGLAQLEHYFRSEPQRGTPDADRFEVLLNLVEHYELKHHPVGMPDPIIAIECRMRDKEMTRRQLVQASSISESRLSEYLNRKRTLTLHAIRDLADILDLPLEVLTQPYPVAKRQQVEA